MGGGLSGKKSVRTTMPVTTLVPKTASLLISQDFGHQDQQALTKREAMAVKKPKRPTSKRKKTPVTAVVPFAGTGAGSGRENQARVLAVSTASTIEAVSVLKSLTPSGTETTSTTSSLLAVKSTKVVPQKKTSLATAQLIRRYHVLNKELSKCLTRIDNDKLHGSSARATRKPLTLEQRATDLARIAEIRQEMDDLGGLDMYQKASTLGQSKQRGGDSSKWLIPVLESCHPQLDRKVRCHAQGCV